MSRVLRLGPAPRLKIQLCVALQFVEDYRPLQIFAQAGSLRVDRLAPGHAILFVDKLGHRNLRKVRISQELGAVEKRPSEGFGNEMNGRRRADSIFAQIVTFEDVQDLHQGNPARRRRRRADDVIFPIAAPDRLALLYFVVGEVFGGNQAPSLLNRDGNLLRHGPVIKVIGIPLNPLQGLSQVGLAKDLTRLVVVPVPLKDAA